MTTLRITHTSPLTDSCMIFLQARNPKTVLSKKKEQDRRVLIEFIDLLPNGQVSYKNLGRYGVLFFHTNINYRYLLDKKQSCIYYISTRSDLDDFKGSNLQEEWQGWEYKPINDWVAALIIG